MLYLYWEITSDINPNSKRHCLGRERFKHRSPTWNECINHPLERLSFECPKVTVAFALLQRYTIGWKSSSLFHPIRVKIKPNRNSLRHVFPLYGSAKCIYAFITGHPGGLTPVDSALGGLVRYWNCSHSLSVLTCNYIIIKSMLAFWLVNQPWVIEPVNPRKDRASSESL